MSTDDHRCEDPLRPAVATAVWKRVAYGFVAVVMILVGLIGVWLPGLPTTPFVLVALWAAARSSDRLSTRLRRIRILRAAIDVAEEYARDRSLPIHLKILSQVMAYSAIGLVWLITHTVWVTVVVACGAVVSSITMALTPTRPRATRIRGDRRVGASDGPDPGVADGTDSGRASALPPSVPRRTQARQ